MIVQTAEQMLIQAAYRILRSATHTKPIWQKNLAPWQCHDPSALPCHATLSLHLEREAMIRMVKRHTGELMLETPLSYKLMLCSVEEMPYLIQQKVQYACPT
jgi:hypothetical protein